MARRRRRVNQKRGRWSRWWAETDRRAKAASAARVLWFGAVGVAGIGACLGLGHLDRAVHAASRFQQPPVIELVDVPAELDEIMRAALRPFGEMIRFEPELCAMIGRSLENDAWVRRVRSIRRLHDGRVLVTCSYRLPAAQIQTDAGFHLIDDHRVRLPGVYAYLATLPLIQGVAGEPPPPGHPWEGGDLAAGAALVRLIAAEPFAHQIAAIQVHNYGGRHAPRDAHIVLATDQAGSLVRWGSAPGEEVEENTSARKIAILRHNFERHGRVDGGFGVIDISVYPDRFTVEG